MPPTTVVAPVLVLVVPVSVSVPLPVFVKASVPVPSASVPEKIPAPTLIVPAPTELLIVPAPVSVPRFTLTPPVCSTTPVPTDHVAAALPALADVSRKTRPAVPLIETVPE